MSLEQRFSPEGTTEKLHPHKILAGAVAYYYQKFVNEAAERGIFLDPKNKIVSGVFRFLGEYKQLMGGVMPEMDDLQKMRNETLVVALLRKRSRHLSQEEFIEENKDKHSVGMLASGAKAWLFKTYRSSFFENLMDIYLEKISFGFQKDVDREQPENAWASDLMMDQASDKIVSDLKEYLKDEDPAKIHTVELGAAAGYFSGKMLKAFSGSTADITDIDEKTQIAARQNLSERGFVEGKDFNLEALDMSNVDRLKEIAKGLNVKKVVVHIGYILHENRDLAIRTLKALAEAFEGIDVIFAFTEYYLQNEITEKVPLHFQGIHYTTQDLFERSEFMQTLSGAGYEILPLETPHNYIFRTDEKGKRVRDIMNSTIYSRLKKVN